MGKLAAEHGMAAVPSILCHFQQKNMVLFPLVCPGHVGRNVEVAQDKQLPSAAISLLLKSAQDGRQGRMKSLLIPHCALQLI